MSKQSNRSKMIGVRLPQEEKEAIEALALEMKTTASQLGAWALDALRRYAHENGGKIELPLDFDLKKKHQQEPPKKDESGVILSVQQDLFSPRPEEPTGESIAARCRIQYARWKAKWPTMSEEERAQVKSYIFGLFEHPSTKGLIDWLESGDFGASWKNQQQPLKLIVSDFTSLKPSGKADFSTKRARRSSLKDYSRKTPAKF